MLTIIRQPVDESPKVSIHVQNPPTGSSLAPVYIVVSDLICVGIEEGWKNNDDITSRRVEVVDLSPARG